MAKVYWWDDIPNAGDRLTPLLLKHFTKLTAELTNVHDADAVVVGSILEHLPPNWPGYVVGSGKLHANSSWNHQAARILALRGPESARNVPGNYALGDAGLLADSLAEPPTRDIRLGLVPHWSDTSLKYRPEFQPYDPVVITPWQDPLNFVKQIGRCHKIVSSSLHGVIIADAFGIPRRTEVADRFATEGGIFKFRDHNGAVGLQTIIGKTQQPRWQVVEDRKSELWDVMYELGGKLC